MRYSVSSMDDAVFGSLAREAPVPARKKARPRVDRDLVRDPLAQALDEQQIRALVTRAQEGETEAFGKVYEHFFDQVYRYAAFHLPGELAEDAVAEIFVKAWEKMHKYKVRKEIPFAAWLFRIARHKVIDVYRSRRVYAEVPEEVSDPDVLNRAESRTERQEMIRMVRAAMEKLPRRYREVLLLSFVSDLPHSAIARVLRMTEGGVRILKMRALRKLETLLPSDLPFSA